MAPTDREMKEILLELTGNDEEFYEELLAAYIANMQEFKLKATEAVNEMDLVGMKENLHKINPTLLTLGYEEEYEQLAEIKERLNPQSIETNLQKVHLISEKVLNQLNKVKES